MTDTGLDVAPERAATVGDEIAFDRWPQDVQALATRVIRARLVEEYEEARDDALAQERAEGYEEGKEDGRAEGFDVGRSEGYEVGYEAGYEKATADLTGMPPQAA
jgi:flagellar biosynthesis/type III secretory pathway protein FliH